MLSIRKSHERGHSQHSWLESYHTFSFAEYYDPKFMGVSHLRVINDDTVQGKGGFPTHSHHNMEIISYVLEGALEHKDSMGNISTITAGELQCMSAGTGVTHSEYNPSATEQTRFLQIWVMPNQRHLTPSYQQQIYTDEQKQGRLCLVVSPDGQDGSMLVHQDAKLFNTLLDKGESVEYAPQAGRLVYIHIAKGQAQINGNVVSNGDGIMVKEESKIVLTGEQQADILLFDLLDV